MRNPIRATRMVVWLGLCSAIPPALGQNRIGVASPTTVQIAGSIFGESGPANQVMVFGQPNPNVLFKLDHVETVAAVPNFLIVSPSQGTTPATLMVAPNPNVTRTMRTGNYVAAVMLTSIDQSPPTIASFAVRLVLSGTEPAVISSVVNAASAEATISPGSMVSILGSRLGPPVLAAEYDGSGRYADTFGNTTVAFNGVNAPLLYVSPGQIVAVAPYSLAGAKTATVTVTHFSTITSEPFSVAAAEISPGIFTSAPSGGTQGVPLNYRFPGMYAPNSAANPAEPGSVVVLFATGAGKWTENAGPEAGISLLATWLLSKPVSLTIGGQPSRMVYRGSAPYQSQSMLQINAFVPEGLGPGPQPVVLNIGGADNAAQMATIAVK